MGELGPLVRGARVSDLHALPPRDLILVLEPDVGHRLRLRLSAGPDAPRLHLQMDRVRAHDGPPGPFFRRAAEELVGASLHSLEQVRGDRLALIEFRDSKS